MVGVCQTNGSSAEKRPRSFSECPWPGSIKATSLTCDSVDADCIEAQIFVAISVVESGTRDKIKARSLVSAPLLESSERSNGDDRLLSVKEASAIIGMSDKWLYQSDVPFVRMGRRRLYMASSLLEYARQRLSSSSLRKTP
jgi:hypothetical protein